VLYQNSEKKEIHVTVNLNDIKDDKVQVTVNSSITTDEITYHIPKTVPGTYSEDNYGRFIDDLQAFDKRKLVVKKTDENSWSIANAKLWKKSLTWLMTL
jgi:predicted metalloprotease with PDZ domain